MHDSLPNQQMNGSPEGLVGDSDNVKVAVRCRPLSNQEIGQGHTSAVTIDEYNSTISVINPSNKEVSDGKRIYKFFYILFSRSLQKLIHSMKYSGQRRIK